MPYQPPPPPRPGAPPPVVVGSGIIKAGEPAAFLIQEDVADYEQGYSDGQSGDPLKNGVWWYRQGWYEAKANRPKRSLQYGMPAPVAVQLAPVTAQEVANYDQGYADGPPNIYSPGADKTDWWYKYGRIDGKRGKGKFGLVAGLPPPLFPIVVQPAPVITRGELALKYPVYELYAEIFGRRIPYDMAVNLDNLQLELPGVFSLVGPILQAGIRFDFAGDGPFDEDEGYNIAGQNGKLAREIRRLADAGKIDPNPARYGLPAWVGAYRRRGSIRPLSKGELMAIGMYDRLLDIAPPMAL